MPVFLCRTEFEKISLYEDLTDQTEEVLKDLSNDQKPSHKLCEALMKGELSADMDALKRGPINHAGWLTTANSFYVLWTKDHGC